MVVGLAKRGLGLLKKTKKHKTKIAAGSIGAGIIGSSYSSRKKRLKRVKKK